MYSLDQLDKETARLRELLQLIQRNKYKADTVWDNFCSEMNTKKQPKKKYFKQHPKNLSDSSSEILSPRPRPQSDIAKAKSINNIKFADPVDDANDDDVEGAIEGVPSTEIVTIREEYPLRCKRSKSGKTLGESAMSKDALKGKATKASEKSSQECVAKKKSSELKPTASMKDVEKDNFESKMQGIIEKCLACMEDIRMQLDIGITPPDGLDDLERRRKRSSEFASRFSRNYLYQLNRQLSDIKRLLKPVSARSSSTNNNLMKQKLTSSYQTILQGLQAYLTHLPISTTVAVPEKIKELLKEIATLCDIQRSYTSIDANSNVKSTDLVDVFEVRSRCLMEKIDEYYSTASVISLLQSQSKFSLLDSTKARKKNNIKSRYSMYNGMPTRKDAYWKRAVAALARKKYNVQSKYKTAYFKHRPPVEKQAVLKPALKTKPIERRSSASIRLKPSMDDDNIKTMVEIEREKNQQLGVDGSTCSFPKDEESVTTVGGALIPLIERLVDKLKEEDKEVTQEHVRYLLQAIDGNALDELAGRLAVQDNERKARLEDDLMEKLVEVIRNHGKEKVPAKDGEGSQIASKKSKNERKTKTITVTGAKNAQLICMKDEDSLLEPLDQSNSAPSNEIEARKSRDRSVPDSRHRLEVHKQKIDIDQNQRPQRRSDGNEATSKRQCRDDAPLKNLQSAPSNGNVSAVSSTERTSKLKISRLPKLPLQPLKMLPKKFALNILEYKINYLKARKGDHMYRKSSVKLPWILMGEIADTILDELLRAVGSEIEVNDVIEGIFASEFV